MIKTELYERGYRVTVNIVGLHVSYIRVFGSA